jgi:hypothetical protein
MNNSKILNNLEAIKGFNPSDSTMKSIKRKLIVPIVASEAIKYKYNIAVLALILIVTTGIVNITKNPMTRATKIVESSISEYSEVNLDKSSKALATLNLNGEPGKYTKEECEEIYNKFYVYIENYKLELDNSNNLEDKRIHQKIVNLEDEMAAKWPKSQ